MTPTAAPRRSSRDDPQDVERDFLETHGLVRPDPAWGDKSAIGGAIGNNSTGLHAQYGKTDAYIEEARPTAPSPALARSRSRRLASEPTDGARGPDRAEADPGGRGRPDRGDLS